MPRRLELLLIFLLAGGLLVISEAGVAFWPFLIAATLLFFGMEVVFNQERWQQQSFHQVAIEMGFILTIAPLTAAAIFWIFKASSYLMP